MQGGPGVLAIGSSRRAHTDAVRRKEEHISCWKSLARPTTRAFLLGAMKGGLDGAAASWQVIQAASGIATRALLELAKTALNVHDG